MPHRAAGWRIDPPVSVPVAAGTVRRAHGELVHVGFADGHTARLVETGHHGRVVGRDEVLEHPRCTGGAKAPGTEDVLVRDRKSRQRRGLARGTTLVRCAGSLEGAIAIDGNEAAEAIVQARDAVEKMRGQLDAAHLATG